MRQYQSNRKAIGERKMTKKAATEGAISRAKGLGTCRKNSLNSDNVHIESQLLVASITFHH